MGTNYTWFVISDVNGLIAIDNQTRLRVPSKDIGALSGFTYGVDGSSNLWKAIDNAGIGSFNVGDTLYLVQNFSGGTNPAERNQFYVINLALKSVVSKTDLSTQYDSSKNETHFYPIGGNADNFWCLTAGDEGERLRAFGTSTKLRVPAKDITWRTNLFPVNRGIEYVRSGAVANGRLYLLCSDRTRDEYELYSYSLSDYQPDTNHQILDGLPSTNSVYNQLGGIVVSQSYVRFIYTTYQNIQGLAYYLPGTPNVIRAFDRESYLHTPLEDIYLTDDNYRPTGAFYRDGLIYVADSEKNRVFVYEVSSKQPILSAVSFFLHPSASQPLTVKGVWGDSSTAWVVDAGNVRIDAYSILSLQGNWAETDTERTSYIRNKPILRNLPAGGVAGDVLKKSGSGNTQYGWAADDKGREVPADGTNGQLLQKSGSGANDYGWATVTTGGGGGGGGREVPTGGSPGNVIKKTGTGDNDYAWGVDDTTPVIGGRLPGKDIETLDAAGIDNPVGICSDSVNTYILDSTDKKIYVITTATKVVDTTKTITLDSANSDPVSIYIHDASGTQIGCVDKTGKKVYLYNITAKTLATSHSLPQASSPLGSTRDTTKVWVVDIPTSTTFTRDSSLDELTMTGVGEVQYGGFGYDGIVYLGSGPTYYAFDPSTNSFDATKTFTVTGSNVSVQSGVVVGGTLYYGDWSNPDTLFAFNIVTKQAETAKNIDITASDNPNGVVSDGTSVWTWDSGLSYARAWNLTTKARESSKDINFSSARASNGRTYGGFYYKGTIYLQHANGYVSAYDPANGSRVTNKEVTLSFPRSGLTGIAFLGDRFYTWARPHKELYYVSVPANKLNSYNATTFAHLNSYLLPSENPDPYGVATDGKTLWISDKTTSEILGYRASNVTRDASKDIANVSLYGNADPRGIDLADSLATLRAVDYTDKKVYVYSLTPPQPDWAETDTKALTFIKNKPTIRNVPTGGTATQVLTKTGAGDTAYGWSDAPGGSGVEGNFQTVLPGTKGDILATSSDLPPLSTETSRGVTVTFGIGTNISQLTYTINSSAHVGVDTNRAWKLVMKGELAQKSFAGFLVEGLDNDAVVDTAHIGLFGGVITNGVFRVSSIMTISGKSIGIHFEQKGSTKNLFFTKETNDDFGTNKNLKIYLWTPRF